VHGPITTFLTTGARIACFTPLLGFVLVEEPHIPELRENYVMVFRPQTVEEELSAAAAQIGAGWAEVTVAAAQPAGESEIETGTS
jgi:hypothetical protein